MNRMLHFGIHLPHHQTRLCSSKLLYITSKNFTNGWLVKRSGIFPAKFKSSNAAFLLSSITPSSKRPENNFMGELESQSVLTFVYPLSPMFDEQQIFPCNTTALENRVVMRIKVMIILDECNWYFNKFSPLLLLKMYRDNKWEFEFRC